MKKYKGIIFDLDGTLLDTLDDLGDSMNEALESLGYPTYEIEQYRTKIGGGFRGLGTNVLPKDTNERVINQLVDIFTKVYDEKYADKTRPYEGIGELLNELVSKGVMLGVNSNKRHSYTISLVDKFFHNIPFVKVYGEREGVPKKDNPYAALEIAEEMGLSVSEILFIGDMRVDIKTARKAGMDSVGVLWGFGDYEELKEFGATYIATNPKDILELV